MDQQRQGVSSRLRVHRAIYSSHNTSHAFLKAPSLPDSMRIPINLFNLNCTVRWMISIYR